MFLLTLIIGILYTLTVSLLLYGWKCLRIFPLDPKMPEVTISVIVPIHNEQEHIAELLQALIDQQYPPMLYTITLVNDHSTDNTLQIIQNFSSPQITLIHQKEYLYGKKAALQTGIESSKGDLILTTDGDCIPGKFWLASFASHYLHFKPVLLFGGVMGIQTTSLFSKIQALEMFSLLGATGGSASIGHPVLCNGANLAFERSRYSEVSQLYQQSEIRSGDDIFLLQELKKKYRHRIHFIKSGHAIIRTHLAQTLKSFMKQRERWVSKAPAYRDTDIIVTAIIIFLTSLWILYTLVLGIVTGNYQYVVFTFLLKTIVDLIFLYYVTDYFHEKKLLYWFLPTQCIYFVYVVTTVFLSPFQSKKW